MYKNHNKTSFQFEHCWNILRYEAKWLEHKDNAKGRNQTASTTSSPTSDDNEELSSFIELERTLGRKAQNELLKKRKRQDDMVLSLSTILDEIKEKREANV